MNIDTSLLREKFIIREHPSKKSGKHLEIEAPSTRMIINLQAGGLSPEQYIIRAYNMHCCARVVAKMISDYEKNGPLLSRSISIDWEKLWDDCLTPYERLYTQNRWLAIYNKGKIVFSQGQRHPFLDVIEKCDAINKGNYEKSITIAEDAFRQAGKEINIQYESNVALVAILDTKDSRCSMILRGPDKTNTFNYSIKPLKEKEKMNIAQGLSSAADFLEGVQLCYFVGINNEKLARGIIEKHSQEEKQNKEARLRIAQLDSIINSMENRYKLRYRPERPDFEIIIAETEKFAKKNLVHDAPDDDDDDIYIDDSDNE